MEKIKTFKEFINETYLEKQVDPELLDNDKKKMKKNGYVEVEVIESVDELKKGDKVLVSSTEFGELDDDSLVTCYKDDEEFMIAKRNLKVDL